MRSTSQLFINREALENNVEFIRSLTGPRTIISAVVKGNAYGHGLGVVVPALEQMGIRHFSVYSSPEARETLRYITPSSTLMIMGYTYLSDLEWIVREEVEFFVSDLEILASAIEIAKCVGKKARVHLDAETGMYRTGLTLPALKSAARMILDQPEWVSVKGVASHFAGAESIANHHRIRKQFTVYNKRVKYLRQLGIEPELLHIASSAATINYPETRLDMVRTGILLYGYWPTRETFINFIHRRKDKTDPLQRALSWFSQVMVIKEVPEGEFIGYGLSFQASQKMRIMVIPVGYCNGYSRSLSNNGYVIVHGQRAPVIGLVNMNMIICDITGIPGVQPGDPITLIGQQGDAVLTFSSFAEMNNSLNYEILARLPENIERHMTNS